jgi:ribosomal-protein-alanine N-acetyltransferase
MIETDLAEVAAMEEENLSPWSVASLVSELAARQAMQYVAEGPNACLIGWCACRVIWPEAELLKIAVRQKYRKGGVGALLLQHLCDTLQKKKVSSLFLEVRSKNRVASNFYEKHGFLHVGSRPDYYTDPPDSAIILKKNLSS